MGDSREDQRTAVSQQTGTAGAAGGRAVSAGAASERPASRTRRIGVRVLIWGTSVLAVLAIFAVWANRELLSPDNWSDTSTKLLQNAAVRDATATYLVDQLYANVNVENEIKARLPKELQALAGPVSGGLRTVGTEVAKRLLASPHVQELWRQANRAADQALVDIVNGRQGAIAV